MATLKMRTSAEVAREVTITAEEVRAMIREKFPMIPDDAVATPGVNAITEELETIGFRWSDKTTNSDETELEPARRKCRRQCAAAQDSRLVQIAKGEANE